MSYTDEYTDKSLKKLENKIKKEYSSAYKEMSDKVDDYFSTLEARYQKEYKAYEAGDYTKEQFDSWYQAQVQRGNSWANLRDNMAERITRANEIASDYINNSTPDIYTQNAMYEAYRITQEAGLGGNFSIYNEDAVKNIITDADNYTEFRTVKTNPIRDYEWNTKQIQSALVSGIIQGKSPSQMADAFLVVMKRNRASAIRNARTAYTSAQNAGRVSSIDKAMSLGVDVQKKWIATNDERTRFSHAMLHGQIRKQGELFSNGLEYPADSKGAPKEVYNCRCTLSKYYPKYQSEQSNEKYADWQNLSEEEQKAELKAYNDWQKDMMDKVAKKLEYKPDNTIIKKPF